MFAIYKVCVIMSTRAQRAAARAAQEEELPSDSNERSEPWLALPQPRHLKHANRKAAWAAYFICTDDGSPAEVGRAILAVENYVRTILPYLVNRVASPDWVMDELDACMVVATHVQYHVQAVVPASLADG